MSIVSTIVTVTDTQVIVEFVTDVDVSAGWAGFEYGVQGDVGYPWAYSEIGAAANQTATFNRPGFPPLPLGTPFVLRPFYNLSDPEDPTTRVRGHEFSLDANGVFVWPESGAPAVSFALQESEWFTLEPQTNPLTISRW